MSRPAGGDPAKADDCPECRAGKHRNCTEVVPHPHDDVMVDCPCAVGGHL